MSLDDLSHKVRNRLLSAVLRDPLFAGAQEGPIHFHPRSARLLPKRAIAGVVSFGGRILEMEDAAEATILAMSAASLHSEIRADGHAAVSILAATAAMAAAGTGLLLWTAAQIAEEILSDAGLREPL